MARRHKKNKPQYHAPAPPRPKVSPAIWLARLCFAAAVGLAAWLLFYTLTEKPMAGCAPGSACDRVMGSAWAYWFNVPVSAPALAIYISLLICSIAIASRRATSAQRATTVGFILSIAVIAVAAWFIYLQLAVIKSVCKYCTAIHVIAVVGALLFLSKVPRPSRKLAFIVAGLLPVAALVAGQKFAPHRINVVTLYRGTLKFDLRDAPLIGSPDAKKFIVDVFDYTCPDCHAMHKHLTAARAQMTNSFSIICVPAPLDAKCNPRMRSTPPKHKDACEYARIGLAMRRISAEKFHDYQDWFFSQPSIPAFETARAKAESLATKDALDKALADPWVATTLKKSVDIYEQNGRETRNYRVPQLVVGEAINFGPVSSPDEIIRLVNQYLPN